MRVWSLAAAVLLGMAIAAGLACADSWGDRATPALAPASKASELAGRWHLITSTVEPDYLLDTASGETWTRCNDEQTPSWCHMPRSMATAVQALSPEKQARLEQLRRLEAEGKLK